MRIAVCHPQTPFARGGAEVHAEGLVRALRDAGHEAELVTVAGAWFPGNMLVHQMAFWRSMELAESNRLPIDAVIALKFPAYLVPHERKIVWLIHQHRTAYELWDHPRYADLARQDEGPAVRDMIRRADALALGEARRIFTNSRNVADRLWATQRLEGEVLYHRSPTTEALLGLEPGPLGDHVFLPGRMEPMKRQTLAIEAMRHVRSGVRLVLAGSGPEEPALRALVERLGVGDRVAFEGRVDDARLHELYGTALAVHYGPYDEDYGYVTLEGFAARRPVVTTADAGGPLEFVEDGTTGLVTAPEPRAIAEAFDRLHADRARGGEPPGGGGGGSLPPVSRLCLGGGG
ncbi:MAG: glycosyltransferase family 4 protein, partial [Actinomycetota bacterium]